MNWKLSEIPSKIHYFLLVIATISLPLSIYPAYNSIAIILMTLNWFYICYSNGSMVLGRFRTNWHLWLTTGFFFYHMVGLWNTANMPAGLFDLQVKVSLVLLPLVIGTGPVLTAAQIERLLRLFVGSLTLCALFCLGYAAYRNYVDNGFEQLIYKYYTYQELGDVIDLHATYFSMYVLMAIFFLEEEIWNHWKRRSIVYRLGLLGLLAFFLCLLLLLSVRMQILTFLVLMLLYTLLVAYQRNRMQVAILGWLGVALLASVVVWNNEILRQRFLEAFVVRERIVLDTQKDNSLGRNWDGSALRLAQWECAVDVIEHNWLLGVGTGDVQDELQRSYEAHKFYFASKYNRFNAHNQYLESFIGLGLAGLLFLLAMWFLPIWVAWRKRYYLGLTLLVIFIFAGSTESVFCLRQGVIFFGLFYPLLLDFSLGQSAEKPLKQKDPQIFPQVYQ